MKKILKKLKVDDKKSGISYPYPEMGDDQTSSEQILPAFLVAFIGHLVIIAAFIFAPPLSFKKPYTPTVVSVRMVSLGDLRPEGSSAQKATVEGPAELKEAPADKPEPVAEVAEAKAAEPEVEIAAVPEKKVAVEKKPVAAAVVEERQPEVSLAPKQSPKEKAEEKPKVKTSLKKETFQPSKVVQSAIEKLERETEGSRPQSLKDTLARLEKEVAKAPSRGTVGERTQSGGLGGGSGIGGGARGTGTGSGLGGGGIGSAKEVYDGLIVYHIQKNWAFSEHLVRGQSNLETLVGIKILPNGEIQDIWIDKKSGNPILDESAIRAIKKSNPLPPLPREIGLYDYKVGLRFTPKGLDI